ncbi:MFS transporter [Achromobacter insuavis]|uniref:MFS transporter n=1 Tax=Achromobacter insuavis TaxID=1287735 RepID=UPI001EEA61F0|nr:MFS transporter [Achromobacter insuavis]
MSRTEDISTSDDALYRKITVRLVPLLFLGYMAASMDRMNVGFAKLQMMDTLGFSDTAFGIGAGIMFVGYGLLEVPSNLLMARIGARKTFVRIMVLWGLTAAATAFVRTPGQFYAVRFLLGMFEAGFFPGVILYLSYWFPASRRGTVITLLSSAAALTNVISGPLSGATMKYLHQVGGLEGWQWVYVTQGLPAVILGAIVWRVLKDGPTPGGWLNDEECRRINENLRQGDAPAHTPSVREELGHVLRMPVLWMLALAYFLTLGANYAWGFWLPTIVRSLGVSDLVVIGLITSIASAVGAMAAIVTGRRSDRSMNRHWYFLALAVTGTVGQVGFVLAAGRFVPSIMAIIAIGISLSATWPLVMVMATDYLPKQLAPSGIAFISSIGILGGAVFPPVFGYLKAQTGGTMWGSYMIAALLLLASQILFLSRMTIRRPTAANALIQG